MITDAKVTKQEVTFERDNRPKGSTRLQPILQRQQFEQSKHYREAYSEVLRGKEKMNDDLFNSSKEALSANPSEGQVEQSVVFPILKLLGYKEKNIHNKVVVRVKAGSKKYEKLTCDLLATDKKLPTIVVEAKSPKRGLKLPDDHSQGISYCFSPDVNTKFLFLTSGYSNRLYEAEKLLFEYDLKNIFDNIEQFKKILLGQELFQKKEVASQDIEKFYSYAHNRMFGEDGIKPKESIDILTKLFLIKTQEERGKSLYNLRVILDYEEEYKNAKDKKRKKIEDKIYKYLADCLQNIDTDLLYPEERAIPRNISLYNLFDIVNKLYAYTLDAIPVEKRGSAFDAFLNNTLKGRELGQVFTHRNIVDFIAKTADLKVKDKVIDPACGTGGFIEKAFVIQKTKLGELVKEDSNEYEERLKSLQSKQIFGIEKDGNVATLAKLSMSMNGDGHTAIYKGNGLTMQNDNIVEGTFNAILTNPPFGSRSVVQVKDPRILSVFNMGKKYIYNKDAKKFIITGKIVDGQDIGVLFLERCLNLLEKKGFLGIILHDGIFSNSTYGYIRQYIREHSRIVGVIKLTDEAFKPYNDGGGTETTILLCKKEQEMADSECFFGIAEHVGYTYKRKKMRPDSNDLPELLKAFKTKSNYKASKWLKLSTIPIHSRIDPQFHCNATTIKGGNFQTLKHYLKNGKILNGFPYKSRYFGKGEKPLVKIAHLNNSLLQKDKLEHIPIDYFNTCNVVRLQKGDIFLGMDGKKEFRASYVDSEVVDVAVNQRIAIIRIDEKKIPSSYVFLMLISKFGQRQLMREKTQTATVAHLSNSLIENVKIPFINSKQIQQADKDFKNYVASTRKTQSMFEKLKT